MILKLGIILLTNFVSDARLGHYFCLWALMVSVACSQAIA